jgi:hypothetical protein
MRTHALAQSQVPEFVAGATTLRIPVKPQPDYSGASFWAWKQNAACGETALRDALLASSRYPAGSLVALTETWCRTGAGFTIYKADNKREQPYWSMLTWRSPATMPAEFSRFKRRVAAVRVERLQDIAYDGILASGWDAKSSKPITGGTAGDDARLWFVHHWNWECGNSKRGYPWRSNPWTRVLTLEEVNHG